MAIPKRTAQPGTYFVTTVTAQRRSLFKVTPNADLLLQTLQHYRRAVHYKLHAFVVMPDHVHLLLTPQAITLERAIGLIKGGFSHSLGATHTPWQRGFTDHRIRNRSDYLQHLNYIHENPLRARLVEQAEQYLYSSAWRAPAAEAAQAPDTEQHG